MNTMQKIIMALFAWMVLGTVIGITVDVEIGSTAWLLLFGIPFGLFLLIMLLTLAGLVVSLALALLIPRH